MARAAWRTIGHGVAKSLRLKQLSTHVSHLTKITLLSTAYTLTQMCGLQNHSS